MAIFEVYRKCNLVKGEGACLAVLSILRHTLSKYYNEGDIIVTNNGIIVNGNLRDTWERAVTKATININIKENELSYKVQGSSSIGKWAWIRFVLGLFTGIFLGWFVLDLVEYIICRDRPKKYFEEAFNAVAFEYGQS
jgi:hypothetical protein